MSYPYLGDLINPVFGVQWYVPIPMFGMFVAVSIIVAIYIAKKETARLEDLGILPKVKVALKGNSKPNYIQAHEIIADLGVVTVLFGIVGARLFHILEYPGQFLNDPISMIFSQGGFTIYGGLLLGVIAGVIYLRKRDVPIIPMLDALSPSLILGYGIGRIGCQISGDGDWGITSNMSLKPSWLPDWLWAQTYENNIVGAVIQFPGVYPTPLYETFIALCIFLILWVLRKHQNKAGFLFSCYLLLSGLERLWIEKIRININYHFFGLEFTQAEFISMVVVIIGLIGILKTTTSKRIPKIVFSVALLGVLSACVML